MSAVRNPWLMAGGMASVGAALAHVACIAGGPDWYRAMGAPPAYVRAAAAGRWMTPLMTAAIAGVLVVLAAYALSGAGLIGRLPLLRAVLLAITAVYLLRGMALFAPALLRRPDLSPGFIAWSSAIVLAMGIVHAIGMYRGWNSL